MDNTLHNFFEAAYYHFNNRHIDALLEMMTTDVHWPNRWEGGYLEGQQAVRDYWLRQWKELNPRVEPESVKVLPDGRISVLVYQLVKNREGKVLSDEFVHHIYTLKDGLIQSMDVDEEHGT